MKGNLSSWRQGQLDWAALENGDAQIMLAHATAPIDPSQQAVLFYPYSPDLAALRDHLAANGVHAGPIRDGTPGPRQEMGLSDPDGYCLMVAQIEDSTCGGVDELGAALVAALRARRANRARTAVTTPDRRHARGRAADVVNPG
jgi:hypothetical protein